MAGNTKRESKSHPTWTDVKARLADFDRAALLDLIRSLYSAAQGQSGVSPFPLWFGRRRAGTV